MGAILVTSQIADTIKPGDHGTTFGGGPLVAAVADHVVRRLADKSLLAAVRENGEWLGARLSELARRSDKVRAVRGLGYMWGIDVVDVAADVVQRGWKEGLLVITAGDHTLRLLPPLTMQRDDLERGLGALERILA
jgi:acetylornithine/N-succinyldiaminopimelate aminotransferase